MLVFIDDGSTNIKLQWQGHCCK
ncbi:plasmid segregation protein ParM [Klebsiella pneumoniae]|nr:plasmid segregation protein ParM [Klebsiella pneumoniae]